MKRWTCTQAEMLSTFHRRYCLNSSNVTIRRRLHYSVPLQDEERRTLRNRPNRNTRDSNPSASRGKRPPWQRDRRSGPSSSQSSKRHGASRDMDEGPSLESCLEEVVREAKEKKGLPPRYEPEIFTKESLITNRIATGAGQSGARSTMNAAMARLGRRDDTSFAIDDDLARQLLKGKLVRFRDDAERARICALAEEYAQETAVKISKRKDIDVEKEDVGFVAVGGQQRQQLVDIVLKGQYEAVKRAKNEGEGAGESMASVERAMQLNGTYSSTAGKGLMDFMKKMWPQSSKSI